MNDSKTVVVAMSGGVDSSTTAALLVERGYTVIGMMMRLWSEPPHPIPPPPPPLFSGVENPQSSKTPSELGEGEAEGKRGGGAKGGSGEVFNRCCSPEAVADARGVCQMLGIPFYLLNFEAAFKSHVVDFFLKGYAQGVTPNPCLECNRQIKFGALLDKAKALGADYLATGHYARVREHDGRFELLRGVDPNKDQSYALSVLRPEQLRHALFPLGEFTKVETREQARRFGLRVAEKHESQDLCFIADGNYRHFVQRNAPADAPGLRPGEIMDTRGRVLGKHEGLAFYTIGQRKGLGIAAGEPLYVLELDRRRNVVIVGRAEELGRRELTASEVNWIAGEPPETARRVTAKIRYRAREMAAEVAPLAPQRARVVFDEPLRDITPGQAIVFYDGEVCLGGGIIESGEPS